MPVPTQTADSIRPDTLRVLITGYGPFREFKVNPSWLAVKPLHNTTVYTSGDSPRPIHITALEVSTTYETVLSITPGFHARPPVLPISKDPAFAAVSPPSDGYDFVLHVGVASRGDSIRLEQLGRKYGYDQDDAEGKYCPIAKDGDGPDSPPIRGFGIGYEGFLEELHTPVDCEKLLEHLRATGIKEVVPSLNAGLYLCEFINYCSLAEARRAASRQGKSSPVLFIHIPPVDQPLSTEHCSEALRSTISWVCSQ